MASLFRRLPITDLFKKVAKMAGIGPSSKSTPAAAAPAAAAPAAGMKTTAAVEDARQRRSRRRARKTGGMRLLMTQGSQGDGGDNKQTTLGPQ